MPGKRRTKTSGSQVKRQRPTTQTTLTFHKTNPGTADDAIEQESSLEHSDPVTPSLQAQDPHPPTQPSRPSKPSQLFPIFTKVSRNTADATEIIDITDMPFDMELSTEPPSSMRQLPLHSDPNQATLYSSPSFRIRSDGRSSDTGTGTRGHELLRKTSRKNELEKRSPGIGNVAPLPSSCSQHVRGVQHSFASNQVPPKRRKSPGSSPSCEDASDFLSKWQLDNTPSGPLDRIHRHLTPQQCDEHLRSLSRTCTESHPAFARISVCQDRIPCAEMWTRRFRPRRANEVLGNEERALYLRDWLRALELQLRGCQPGEPVPSAKAREGRTKGTLERVSGRGVKRPRVIRAVTGRRGKKKKRRVDSDDDLDDFVVFTDDEEEQADVPPDDSEDELAFCQQSLARLHRRNMIDALETHSVASNASNTETDYTMTQSQERDQKKFGDNLTNSLLITGPPGCGKTAAVYACAEELGWEIFEVYPGIGKRNGASLDHLVGDVGKNHMVQTADRRVSTKTTILETKLGGYLVKNEREVGSGESREAGTAGQPISVEDDVPSKGHMDTSEVAAAIFGMCHADTDGSRPAIRQSLVLLEEVDILFKDDGGFWPAVVEFIRGCQRPVVMTCNDPGLVPVSELALQKVVVFEPCPSPVATTFLQCMSLTEGCLVPHEDLMALYEATHSEEIPDGGRTEGVPMGDLRRSITQLQMLCAGARHGSASGMHQGEEAEGHVRRSAGPISAECRDGRMGSRVEGEWWREMKDDSELMSHVDAELWKWAMGTGEVSEEEMGYVVLEERGGEDVYGRDELIKAIRHSRGVHEESGTGPMDGTINPAASQGLRARVEYRSRMADAMEDILRGTGAVMAQSVFLDYIPWVREMVRVEDMLEERAREEMRGRGSGRWTWNSVRRVQTGGWLCVGEDGRQALRGTGLGNPKRE